MRRAGTYALVNVAVAGLTLAAFTGGWWIGRTTTRDIETGDRLARIEDELRSLRQAVSTPSHAAPAVSVPAAPSATAGPDPGKRYEIEIGDSPVLGPDDAAVTIVEFSDFECPFCASASPTLERLMREYPSRIRRVFKHNPMPFHHRAVLAHRAAAAAHAQGKFWEMHDLLFGSQDKLDRESLSLRAKQLELDLAFFDDFLASGESMRAVTDDKMLAGELSIMGVPSFFINGRYLAGAQSYEVFKDRNESALRED